jgi:hypothetical protein
MGAIQYVGTGRLGTVQSASYTDTAGTIANGVGPQTYKVRVVCTSDAFIVIDNSPTATTSGTFMPAGEVEYFTITPGQKVSAVQSTDAGTLNVTEVS